MSEDWDDCENRDGVRFNKIARKNDDGLKGGGGEREGTSELVRYETEQIGDGVSVPPLSCFN